MSSGDRWTTARIVNQDVQAPIPILDGIDNSLRCGRVANVRTKEGGDFFIVGNGLSRLTTTHGNHLGALTQQRLADSTANVTGATGDQTYLSFQFRHCCFHCGLSRVHTV